MLEKLKNLFGRAGGSRPSAPVRQGDEVPAPVSPNDSTASETTPEGQGHPAPSGVKMPPSPEAFGQRRPEDRNAG